MTTLAAADEQPCVPAGLRLYAIGDIHGQADLLYEKLRSIDADRAERPDLTFVEVFLGDYIDRGPGSRDVLDVLLQRQADRNAVLLLGNHEQMLLSALENADYIGAWARNGGRETLLSYGVRLSLSSEVRQISAEMAERLPPDHLELLNGLRTSYACGDYFFVHAGVRPHKPLAEQRIDDMLWIRDEFLQHTGRWEKIIVHGHTPTRQPDVRSNRINIDTGAFMTGRLTCLVLEGCERRFL